MFYYHRPDDRKVDTPNLPWDLYIVIGPHGHPDSQCYDISKGKDSRVRVAQVSQIKRWRGWPGEKIQPWWDENKSREVAIQTEDETPEALACRLYTAVPDDYEFDDLTASIEAELNSRQHT